MKVVCFSETPLEHVYTLFQEIAGRDVHLSTYGLALTKEVARRNGINPVWYVDMSRDRYGDWEIAKALDALRTEAAASPAFASHPVSKILPFIEAMGTWGPFSRKEFSWEREWRRVGDFRFLPDEVALVFCPESDIREFEATGEYRAVDPSWSLERMINHLRRLSGGMGRVRSNHTATAIEPSQVSRSRPPIVVVGSVADEPVNALKKP